MTTKIAEVGALIRQTVGAAAGVFHAYPATWAKVPLVAYRETGNRDHSRADGKEHLTELEYTVDIWSTSAEEAHTIAANIDDALSEVGFRRTQAQTLFEERTRYVHRMARYRALADSQRIYQ